MMGLYDNSRLHSLMTVILDMMADLEFMRNWNR